MCVRARVYMHTILSSEFRPYIYIYVYIGKSQTPSHFLSTWNRVWGVFPSLFPLKIELYTYGNSYYTI
jgi:hypothetical protein